jgi:nucleotide-binding universal stress UspA family protein
VAPRFFGLHPRPPILCGDGDEAGQQATAAWVDRAMRVHHREVLTLSLPSGLDPAEWLQQEGDLGLVTFSRAGCLDDDEHVRAQPAGALLARCELDRAIQIAIATDPNVQTVMVAPIVIERLGQRAAQLDDAAALHRFAVSAGAALADLMDGLSAEGRARQVLAAAQVHAQAAPRSPEPRAVREAMSGGIA